MEDTKVLSNVLPEIPTNVYVQVGVGDFFVVINAVDNERTPVNWSLMQSLKIDVVDINGRVWTSYSAGNGLDVDTSDNTSLNWVKNPTDHNIPFGFYYYDLKCTIGTSFILYPMRGSYNVTK